MRQRNHEKSQPHFERPDGFVRWRSAGFRGNPGDDAPAVSLAQDGEHGAAHLYQLIEHVDEARELAALLAAQSSVAFDTETTSLSVLDAELVGMSFAYEKGKAYYVAVPEQRDKAQEIVDAFAPFWTSEGVEKIGQNIKYDLSVLMNYDVGGLWANFRYHDRTLPDSTRHAPRDGYSRRDVPEL
jgi:hypothetical protein